MKFRVLMKDPDTLYDAIRDAMKEQGRVLAETLPDDDEREAVLEKRQEKVRELCQRWFEYGEYLQVEIDTEAETATIIPVKS